MHWQGSFLLNLKGSQRKGEYKIKATSKSFEFRGPYNCGRNCSYMHPTLWNLHSKAISIFPRKIQSWISKDFTHCISQRTKKARLNFMQRSILSRLGFRFIYFFSSQKSRWRLFSATEFRLMICVICIFKKFWKMPSFSDSFFEAFLKHFEYFSSNITKNMTGEVYVIKGNCAWNLNSNVWPSDIFW